MNNDQEQDRGEFAPCPLPDREQRIQDGDLMNVMRQDVVDMEAFVGSGKPVVFPFKPDWDTQAVLVEEMQRMAKRIEELEAMPKEVDVKHKTKYYALLKEYDRVCYLLDKATDKITDQDQMLAIQTSRIVDLQTHIENLEGEE